MEITNSKNFKLYSEDTLQTELEEINNFLNSTNYSIKIVRFDKNKEVINIKYQYKIKYSNLGIRSLNIMLNYISGKSFKYYIEFEDEDDELIFKLRYF